MYDGEKKAYHSHFVYKCFFIAYASGYAKKKKKRKKRKKHIALPLALKD